MKGRNHLGNVEDNIKMDVREIEREEVDWSSLAQDRVHWWSFVNRMVNL
jgi:hypothetical protein